MKGFVILLLTVSTVASGQELNSNARQIKSNYNESYEEVLKKHALDEWNDDYEMVIYQINTEADALNDLVDMFKSEHTNIAFDAIKEWSYDGYKNYNIKKFRATNTFSLSKLVEFHCEWQMVKHSYEKEVKAKNALD